MNVSMDNVKLNLSEVKLGWDHVMLIKMGEVKLR